MPRAARSEMVSAGLPLNAPLANLSNETNIFHARSLSNRIAQIQTACRIGAKTKVQTSSRANNLAFFMVLPFIKQDRFVPKR